MKNREKLEELLKGLDKSDREKFEYILNFYTEEHVFYNFHKLKRELENFSIFSCTTFKRPLERNLKEIADNLDLITMMRNFQSVKTAEFETETKSVSDFLLYIRDYTDEDDSKKKSTITSLHKYSGLIHEGYITEQDVLDEIRRVFSNRVDNLDSLDLQNLERELNYGLAQKIRWNTDILSDLEDTGNFSNMFMSEDLVKRLAKVDFSSIIRKQHGVVSNDITILLLKTVSGDDFENLEHEDVERLKAMLSTFNLKTIKEEDIQLIEDNFDGIYRRGLTALDLYYIKNIAKDENALLAYNRLPKNLKDKVLKLNIIARPEEVSNVMDALNFCKLKQREGKKEDLTNTKYYFSKLPPEKRAQMIEIIKEEPVVEYKRKLDIGKEFSFGFELEAEGVRDRTVIELLNQRELSDAIYKTQGIKKGIPRSWKIDYDGTVPNGLEVISPIIHDKEEDWEELKEVCKTLNAIGAKIGETCGGHIHIGANILGTNSKAWENFLEIWALAEEPIYKMSNKAGELPRQKILSEAGPTKPIIDDLLSRGSIKLETSQDVRKLADCYTRRYMEGSTVSGRNKGLNLCPIAEAKQDTIEFRVPNGSIDYIEIQRNAELYARILRASRMMAEDPEYKKDIFEKLRTAKTGEEKAVYLLDLIFDKTVDKAIYYERYFSQKEKLELSGKSYEDIANSDVEIDSSARYDWRGHR